MPEMDGLQTVRELRKIYPRLPVIMFSTLTLRGAESTLDALAAGATDYVTKPANVGNVLEGIERLKSELIPKIKLHCRKLLPPVGVAASLPAPAGIQGAKVVSSTGSGPDPQIFAIGCSTGGPNALAALFADITRPLPVPGVIVQHMPPLFTKMLAERLDRNSPNRFFEGETGQLLEPGCLYVAPGGRHMEVRREGLRVRLHLHDDPPENSCRPAVDVLFRSVAAVYGPPVLGLIMTGMGQDGLRGCQHIRERGGRVLAQDEATSVVWGMPGYVVQAGLAEKVLPLPQLGGEVMRRFRLKPGG
jgi:two-component system chemotaxis response regulator CheB